MEPRISRDNRILVRVALAGAIAVAVLGGVACRGKKEEKPEPAPAASTAASGAAASSAAKGAQSALKTDIQPLSVNVPVAPPKLDGLDVTMPAINTAIKGPATPDLSIALPQVSIGAIAMPSVSTAVTIAPPSLQSLIPAILPGVSPTLPGGIAIPPGFIPPGFPTPPR